MKKNLALLLITLFFSSSALAQGPWLPPSPPMPREVQIRYIDWNALMRFHPQCQMSSADWLPCRAAVDRACQAYGDVGGFGLLNYTSSQTQIACFSRGVVMPIEVPIEELRMMSTGCNGMSIGYASSACMQASRYACLNRGFVASAGPTEASAFSSRVLCIRQAPGVNVRVVSTGALQAFVPSCVSASSQACRSASHAFCVAEGYEAGVGSPEGQADLLTVSCLGRPFPPRP